MGKVLGVGRENRRNPRCYAPDSLTRNTTSARAGIVFLSTPSHGYLAVPRENVHYPTAQRIARESDYSWNYGGTAYLEEDCDAPAFLDAAGIAFAPIPCRSIPDYPPGR